MQVREDFIERLIRQVMNMLRDMLNTFLNGDSIKETEIQDIYSKFLNNDRKFYRENNTNDILNSFSETYKPNEVLARIEILAELLLFESKIVNTASQKSDLLKKSLDMFLYVENNGISYSMERNAKIKRIESDLSVGII
ncbi:MAG: hypothetical protein N4A32_08650 [Marinifilaceae bacterium]|jgi:hypothetical protein|nr:hypothetical protein [Marinifilaceae bacterium]